jgi:hypothetical protein
MEITEAIILDAGWLFFTAWAVVLATVSVIAFGWDVLPITQRDTGTTIKRVD